MCLRVQIRFVPGKSQSLFTLIFYIIIKHVQIAIRFKNKNVYIHT
jgi:hypothetical protein